MVPWRPRVETLSERHERQIRSEYAFVNGTCTSIEHWPVPFGSLAGRRHELS